MLNMNVLDMIKRIKLNPRELIRRLIKIIFLVLILYLSLTSTNKLNNSEISQIICINTIIYCVIEMLFPSIHLQK
jgi:hypothetical protein